MSVFETPIPLSELESVLAWVDTFKLSRATKKINRDFSDAVLLAEILSVHYPKLVEMHNYPPRNSHSLKLNNWMTLNRKVLKKLKLSLCLNTMEQLSNSAPGVIERVLIMVREKIRRDEEANKASKEENTGVSSGGSYYEACGDDEHVLIVPVKTRINGVLETLQQKVVSHESYCALKEELKDAKDANDVLRQKVEHLDSLLKLKDERIDELQNQLERKQARRKETETQQSTYTFTSESVLSPHISNDSFANPVIKSPSLKTIAKDEDYKLKVEEVKNTVDFNSTTEESGNNISIKAKVEEYNLKPVESKFKLIEFYNNLDESKLKMEDKEMRAASSKTRFEESRIPVLKDSQKSLVKPCSSEIYRDPISETNVTNVRSDVFKDADVVIVDDKFESGPEIEEFKDSEGCGINFEDMLKANGQMDNNNMWNVINRKLSQPNFCD